MKLLEEAMRYTQSGFSVIPLLARDKKPSLATWKPFQERIATESELTNWFGSESQLNLGIVTGKVSGLTVIDCDSVAAVNLATKLGIPTCPTVRTAKGFHFYFLDAGVSNFQKRDDLPGIDLRGEGGYVVAPPSVHPTGIVYSWEGFDRCLVDLPHWVLASKKQKTSIAELYTGASEGNRNDSLARLSGVWAKWMSYEDALATAFAWNTFNHPPLGETEIRTTVTSIFRKEKSKTTEISEAEIISIRSLQPNLRIIYDKGLPRGEKTGWHTLDQNYTVRKSEWTVVTGIPGAGKTEFIDHLMINLSDKGWKFGIFSAENLPYERHVISLLEKWLGKPFNPGPNQRLTESEIATGLTYLSTRFFFINPDETDIRLERILDLAKILVEKHQIDGLVIDPWNELDHSRSERMSETEFISACLTKIRRFARTHKLHIWVVAHPAKMYKNKEGEYPVPTPYDISGSAHWRNKADNAICVWRDVTKPEKPTEIHIQKIRFREVGKIGISTLKYDVVSGCFYDDSILGALHCD